LNEMLIDILISYEFIMVLKYQVSDKEDSFSILLRELQ